MARGIYGALSLTDLRLLPPWMLFDSGEVKEMDNNGKSRTTSALTYFFSFLVTDKAGYIAARTVVHAKVFRSQVGHRNRYTSH